MVREFTTQDFEQFKQAINELKQKGFATEPHHSGADRNGELIAKYFQDNPTILITAANIVNMVEHQANRKLFAWRTKDEQKMDKAFHEAPDQTRAVHDWLQTQGKPGQLAVSQANLAILLAELRGHQISPQTIQSAIGRIMFKPNKLQWVPEKGKFQHLSEDELKAYRPGRLFETSIQQREREKAEKAAQERKLQVSNQPKQETDMWQQVCLDQCRTGTHGQQAQLREIYDRGVADGLEFRQIHGLLRHQIAQWQFVRS